MEETEQTKIHRTTHNIYIRVTPDKTTRELTPGNNITDSTLPAAHHTNKVQVGTLQSRSKETGGINLHSLLRALSSRLEDFRILEGIFHPLIKLFHRILPFEPTR